MSKLLADRVDVPTIIIAASDDVELEQKSRCMGARTLLRKAQTASGRRRWDDARALYARIAKGRLLDEWGQLGLSEVALATGDSDAAIRHATIGLRVGGGVAARLSLANALSKKGK